MSEKEQPLDLSLVIKESIQIREADEAQALREENEEIALRLRKALFEPFKHASMELITGLDIEVSREDQYSDEVTVKLTATNDEAKEWLLGR